MMRDFQHRAVDAIKRHALTISVRSRKAHRQVLQEYLWIEEGAEAIALDRIPPEAPWLDKLVTRQLADETRHATLLRARLAELGLGVTRPPPSILKAKLWWLDRACEPYKRAFAAGPIVVLLAVAAQLETTGVRMFERHLGVLEELAPDDPSTAMIRSILGDERRHAKSCLSAARKLLQPGEHEKLEELREKAAQIDRAFGITISLGFWINIAATALRDREPAAVMQVEKAAA
jgi:hypothetical protein